MTIKFTTRPPTMREQMLYNAGQQGQMWALAEVISRRAIEPLLSVDEVMELPFGDIRRVFDSLTQTMNTGHLIDHLSYAWDAIDMSAGDAPYEPNERTSKQDEILSKWASAWSKKP